MTQPVKFGLNVDPNTGAGEERGQRAVGGQRDGEDGRQGRQ